MSDSRRSLGNVTRDWFRVGSKALTFGLAAAAGCFLGALIGEAFLWASSDSRPQTPAVCLLIDCSGSMLLDDTGEGKPKKLYEVKEAARQFVHRRHESGDRIAVVGFGTSVHPGTKLTADETELNRAIETLYDGGGTAMDDAIRAAALELPESAGNASGGSLRNILLFTDGQPDDQKATLEAARTCRSRGIRIVAIATGDADVDYLAKVTDDPALVFRTTSGNFGEAFQKAEKTIYGSLIGSTSAGHGPLARILQTGIWTALVTVGCALALVAGQNRYLHRPLFTGREALVAGVGGVGVGLLAGGVAQVLFLPASALSNVPLLGRFLGRILDALGRILGWSLLVALMGAVWPGSFPISTPAAPGEAVRWVGLPRPWRSSSYRLREPWPAASSGRLSWCFPRHDDCPG